MGIYKQEGMYHASVMVGGVRYHKALGVRMKNEAEKEYRQFRDQIDAGLISAHPTRLQRLTFGEVLQQWLEDRRRGIGRLDKPALSPKTLTTEAERAVIVGGHLGHLKIASMPPGAIEEYIKRRRGEGTSTGQSTESWT